MALLTAGLAHAEDYPNHPVRLIVPFGAGGPTDVFARALADELRKVSNQSFIIDNRPGAGTTIGTAEAAKAAPDGYTLVMVTTTQTTVETLSPNKPYKLMRDFVPVAAISKSELVMVVRSSLPVNSLAEFIALARAKPGTLNYASSGIGSNYHMAAEMVKNLAGLDIVHVPYKGSTGARNDIIAGQIDMMFDLVPTMAPMIETGRVKALGTSGRVRSAALPNVPTLMEAGLPEYEATPWGGVMAPAGTPEVIIDKLNTEINNILALPHVREVWRAQGVSPVIMTPSEFGALVQSEIERWAKIIKANGIKGD
jgi:tripartite-type tricarboxylate transporter receptor subunit TctC